MGLGGSGQKLSGARGTGARGTAMVWVWLHLSAGSGPLWGSWEPSWGLGAQTWGRQISAWLGKGALPGRFPQRFRLG